MSLVSDQPANPSSPAFADSVPPEEPEDQMLSVLASGSHQNDEVDVNET